jgi:hypothetical protein
MIDIKINFMAKWEDYVVTQVSFDNEGKNIEAAFVYNDYEDYIHDGELRDRKWLVAEAERGKTFCGAAKAVDGWYRLGVFSFQNSLFKWNYKLPQAIVKRKIFLSYYHFDDQKYKEDFQKITHDFVICKSVENNDIDSDNSAEYVKQLIHKDYISDTTILIVLIGPKTKCRKHVDWEIAGALNHKVGDRYSGLIGILLPTHPNFNQPHYHAENLPQRLAANAKSGYAKIYDWTTDRVNIQNWIEDAFERRTEDHKIENLSIPQMKKNTCDR